LFDVVVLLQSQSWLAGEWLECLAEVDLEVERLKQQHWTYGSQTESATPSSDQVSMTAAGTAATVDGSRTEHLAYGHSSAAMHRAQEETVRSKAKYNSPAIRQRRHWLTGPLIRLI
jgi:hypothetical protein